MKLPSNPFRKKRESSTNLIGTKIDSKEYGKKYKHMVKNSKYRRRRKIAKIALIFLGVLLGLAIIALSVFAYLYYSGKGQFNQDEIKPSLPSVVEKDENTVENEGITYVYDENVTAILCIGVDKDEQTQIMTDKYGTAGQADALFLVCIDNEEKKYTVLAINRDAMIDIDTYSTAGNFSGIKKMQACISFAYGDGKEISCNNTVKAISRMLYNVPIDSYFSINKASIPLLNDIIGGVDVPVYDNNGKVTGEITHIEGKDAYNYIHYRDTSKLDSNVVRIKRQTSYIKAFASKFIARTKQDLSTPLEIFETVSIYSTTDLNASKITYLTTNAFSDRNDIKIDFKSVPGKVVEGKGGFAEFEIDNEGLLQVVLDIFYDKVEQPASTTQK